MQMQIETKRRATKEDKERAKNSPAQNGNSGRGDTWTNTQRPIYDENGRQIGSLNDNSYHSPGPSGLH